jgi:hypothetical protein
VSERAWSGYSSGGYIGRRKSLEFPSVEFPAIDDDQFVSAEEAIRRGLAYIREHYAELSCPTPTTPA